MIASSQTRWSLVYWNECDMVYEEIIADGTVNIRQYSSSFFVGSGLICKSLGYMYNYVSPLGKLVLVHISL